MEALCGDAAALDGVPEGSAARLYVEVALDPAVAARECGPRRAARDALCGAVNKLRVTFKVHSLCARRGARVCS